MEYYPDTEITATDRVLEAVGLDAASTASASGFPLPIGVISFAASPPNWKRLTVSKTPLNDQNLLCSHFIHKTWQTTANSQKK